MRRLAGGLALAGLVIVAGGLLFLFHLAVTPQTVDRPPDPMALAGEDVTVESDGLRLVARLHRPTGAPVASVLLLDDPLALPGMSPSRPALIEALAERGLAVLVLEWRGAGGSGGDWRTTSIDAFARDAALTLSRLRALVDARPASVLAVGSAVDVAAVLVTTSAPPDRVAILGDDLRPVFARLHRREIARLRARGLPERLARPLAGALAWHRREVREALRWAAVGDFDPLASLGGTTVPILVLHDDVADLPVDRLPGAAETRAIQGLRAAMSSSPAEALPPGLADSLAAFLSGAPLSGGQGGRRAEPRPQ